MSRFYRPILLLYCFSLLIGCKKAADDPTVIVTTDPEFQIDLFEQTDPLTGNPTFGLWIRSVEKFSCSNYQIKGSVQAGGSDIRVHLMDVSAPDTCENGAAVAQTFLPIGKLVPGAYSFSLTLGNAIENEGTLHVFDDRYELSVEHPQGVHFQNLVLKKIPQGLIWGYIVTPDNLALARADAFLADLKNLTTEHTLESGFYSYFTLSGTGLTSLHPGFAPTASAQLFVRQSETAPENLQMLLQQYRSAPQTPVQIRCLSTFGEL